MQSRVHFFALCAQSFGGYPWTILESATTPSGEAAPLTSRWNRTLVLSSLEEWRWKLWMMQLAKVDARKSQVVDLRYFGG